MTQKSWIFALCIALVIIPCAYSHPGSWSVFKSAQLRAGRLHLRMSGSRICMTGLSFLHYGEDFCYGDQSYMAFFGFSSNDFHPNQLDSNVLHYYWPANLTSAVGQVGMSGRKAGYQQLYLDSGGPFDKRRSELGYNCVMTGGSDSISQAFPTVPGGSYWFGRYEPDLQRWGIPYPYQTQNIAFNVNNIGWLSHFTSANWSLRTDFINTEWGEQDRRLRVYVTKSDAPMWTNWDDYGAARQLYDIYEPGNDGLDKYGGTFIRCDGKVYFAYSKLESRSGFNWNISVQVAWVQETDTVPSTWGAWTYDGTVINFIEDAEEVGWSAESMAGAYWWQVSGGAKASLTCTSDQTIVLASIQVAERTGYQTAGWIAWKRSGSSQWESAPSNPVLPSMDRSSYSLRFDAMGPWVVAVQQPPSQYLKVSYAHSTNLTVWTHKMLDFNQLMGTTGCSGSYALHGGACNGTVCFYTATCDDQNTGTACGIPWVRLLTLTASPCGLNGFSQAGHHCVPGEVSNCESNCRCASGFIYSHTSAFGGCVPGIAPPIPPPMAPPVAPPAAAPTAIPVATPTAIPVATPTAIPVATPTAIPVATPVSSAPVQAPEESPASSSSPVSTLSPTAAAPVDSAPTARYFWRFNVTASVPTAQQLTALEAIIAQILSVPSVSLVFVSSKRSIQAIVVLDLVVPSQNILNSVTASASTQQQIRDAVSNFLNAPVSASPAAQSAPSSTASAPGADGISSGGLGSGGIAGIVVGIIAAIIIAIIIVVIVLRNQKRGDQPKTATAPAEQANSKPKRQPKPSSSSSSSSLEEESEPKPVKSPKTSKKQPKNKQPESEEESSEQAATVYGSISNSPTEPTERAKEFRDEWIIEKDDLEIGPKIGKGSFGTVFSGSYGGSKVAIKQCSLSLDDDALKEFKRESIFMLGLKKHPAIVSVLGVCQDDEQLFVVMEFQDSGSLDRLVNELTLDQKLAILDSVAKGIAHLHRCGVVHRDLAARNILLNETRDGFTAKVSDFGMSRMVDKFEQQGQTNASVGPVKYMAPESLAKKLYSFASDVWTFAVLVSEIMSGMPPHASLDLFTAGLRIRDEGLTPALTDDTPDWLQALCKRCWSMKPSARPTMDDIVKEFKAHVAQHAGTIRAPKSTLSTLGSKSTASPSSSAQPIASASSDSKLLPKSEKRGESSNRESEERSEDSSTSESDSQSDEGSEEEEEGEESSSSDSESS